MKKLLVVLSLVMPVVAMASDDEEFCYQGILVWADAAAASDLCAFDEATVGTLNRFADFSVKACRLRNVTLTKEMITEVRKKALVEAKQDISNGVRDLKSRGMDNRVVAERAWCQVEAEKINSLKAALP